MFLVGFQPQGSPPTPRDTKYHSKMHLEEFWVSTTQRLQSLSLSLWIKVQDKAVQSGLSQDTRPLNHINPVFPSIPAGIGNSDSYIFKYTLNAPKRGLKPHSKVREATPTCDLYKTCTNRQIILIFILIFVITPGVTPGLGPDLRRNTGKSGTGSTYLITRNSVVPCSWPVHFSFEVSTSVLEALESVNELHPNFTDPNKTTWKVSHLRYHQRSLAFVQF